MPNFPMARFKMAHNYIKTARGKVQNGRWTKVVHKNLISCHTVYYQIQIPSDQVQLKHLLRLLTRRLSTLHQTFCRLAKHFVQYTLDSHKQTLLADACVSGHCHSMAGGPDWTLAVTGHGLR